MQELRDLANKILWGFIVDPPYLLSAERVQGVNLEIDSFWLRSYRAMFSYWAETEPASFSYRLRKMVTGDQLDWDWRPKTDWAQHWRTKGFPIEASETTNPHPVEIVILLRESPDRKFLADAPKTFGPHLIRYEAREPCVAYATHSLSPGDKVGGLAPSHVTSGTLGGLLRDQNSGQMYAISCEHVCGGVGATVVQPPRKLPPPNRVATVVYSTVPPAQGRDSKCNRVTQPIPVPDLAIAELHPDVVSDAVHKGLGKVQRITPIAEMTSEDLVTFDGAASPHTEAKVGGLNIWREILIHGTPHCVGDLFTIEPRKRWYVKPELSQGGDSGSWVLNETNGIISWDGMLIGGDGVQAYCCFAELIYAECAKHLSSLALP